MLRWEWTARARAGVVHVLSVVAACFKQTVALVLGSSRVTGAFVELECWDQTLCILQMQVRCTDEVDESRVVGRNQARYPDFACRHSYVLHLCARPAFDPTVESKAALVMFNWRCNALAQCEFQNHLPVETNCGCRIGSVSD